MMYVLKPIVFFAVALVMERFVLLSNGFDGLRKNPPSDEEVRARFGLVKFPRTFLLACTCASLWLPIDQRPWDIVAISCMILYLLAGLWDGMTAKRYFKWP